MINWQRALAGEMKYRRVIGELDKPCGRRVLVFWLCLGGFVGGGGVLFFGFGGCFCFVVGGGLCFGFLVRVFFAFLVVNWGGVFLWGLGGFWGVIVFCGVGWGVWFGCRCLVGGGGVGGFWGGVRGVVLGCWGGGGVEKLLTESCLYDRKEKTVAKPNLRMETVGEDSRKSQKKVQGKRNPNATLNSRKKEG